MRGIPEEVNTQYTLLCGTIFIIILLPLNDNIYAADTPLNSSYSPDTKIIYINNLITMQKNVPLEVNLDETVKDRR